jgi:hypothetical protein
MLYAENDLPSSAANRFEPTHHPARNPCCHFLLFGLEDRSMIAERG